MTTIYLVRHAEAEGNLYRIAHGHYNSWMTGGAARSGRWRSASGMCRWMPCTPAT